MAATTNSLSRLATGQDGGQNQHEETCPGLAAGKDGGHNHQVEMSCPPWPQDKMAARTNTKKPVPAWRQEKMAVIITK
jgi:hypothetical protein